MRLVTGISQYTGKNILVYMIMADCKYPWVAEAWSLEEKYVAVGTSEIVTMLRESVHAHGFGDHAQRIGPSPHLFYLHLYNCINTYIYIHQYIHRLHQYIHIYINIYINIYIVHNTSNFFVFPAHTQARCPTVFRVTSRM